MPDKAEVAIRYPNGPGTAGPQRHQDNYDLYACPQPRSVGRSQSRGRALRDGCYADPHKMPR